MGALQENVNSERSGKQAAEQRVQVLEAQLAQEATNSAQAKANCKVAKENLSSKNAECAGLKRAQQRTEVSLQAVTWRADRLQSILTHPKQGQSQQVCETTVSQYIQYLLISIRYVHHPLLSLLPPPLSSPIWLPPRPKPLVPQPPLLAELYNAGLDACHYTFCPATVLCCIGDHVWLLCAFNMPSATAGIQCRLAYHVAVLAHLLMTCHEVH